MELDLIQDGDVYARELKNKVKKTSVPQIFINGEHIGGCDQLMAANEDGTLDQKLAHSFRDAPTSSANNTGALNGNSTPKSAATVAKLAAKWKKDYSIWTKQQFYAQRPSLLLLLKSRF